MQSLIFFFWDVIHVYVCLMNVLLVIGMHMNMMNLATPPVKQQYQPIMNAIH